MYRKLLGLCDSIVNKFRYFSAYIFGRVKNDRITKAETKKQNVEYGTKTKRLTG